jgi:hypothetical protein
MLNKKLQKIVAAGLVAGFLTCSTGVPVAAAAGPQPGGQPPRQEQQVNNQQKRPAPQQNRGPQNSSSNSSWNRDRQNRPEYRPAPRDNNRRYDPPRRDNDSHSDTGNLVTGILIGGVIGAIIANNT